MIEFAQAAAPTDTAIVINGDSKEFHDRNFSVAGLLPEEGRNEARAKYFAITAFR
jgi:hypothetical protein